MLAMHILTSFVCGPLVAVELRFKALAGGSILGPGLAPSVKWQRQSLASIAPRPSRLDFTVGPLRCCKWHFPSLLVPPHPTPCLQILASSLLISVA